MAFLAMQFLFPAPSPISVSNMSSELGYMPNGKKKIIEVKLLIKTQSKKIIVE